MVSSGRVTVASAGVGWIPDVWSTETLDAIQHETLLADSTDKRLEAMMKFGDVAHVPRISNLTTQTKSAGSDVTFEQISEGEQQLTIATHEYAAVYVEDITEAQSQLSVRAKYTDAMGYTLARGQEVSVAALFQSFATIVGTLGVELTEDNIIAAWSSLNTYSAPMSDRFIALSPGMVQGLAKIDTFRSQLYGGSAGEMTRNGQFLGNVFGAKVLMSNLLRSPSAGQAEGAMYHRNQMYMVRQIKPTTIPPFHNPAGIGWQVVQHNLYGLAEVNRPPETPGGGTAIDVWGVLLRSAA